MDPAQCPGHEVKAAAGRRVAVEKRSQNVDAKDQQSQSHQSLGDPIDAMRQRELKDDDGAAQHTHHCRVSQRVEQTKPHTAPATGLHTGDVGDGGNVVIVESVTEAKDRRR